MKKAAFLALIIFFLSLTLWIYFNAIKEGAELFDISAISFHFITFQYLAILLSGFYYKKQIIMASFLGKIVILIFFSLIIIYFIGVFEEGMLMALFAPMYLTLIFAPFFFLFVPVHLFMIYIQYTRIGILSKYYYLSFCLLLGMLLFALIPYYKAFESIVSYSIPEAI